MLFLKIVRAAVFINSPLFYNKVTNVSQSLGCEKALPAFQKVLSTMRLVLLPPSPLIAPLNFVFLQLFLHDRSQIYLMKIYQ